ncbi:MAG TPA: BLUF domain-containing protein, partial [Stellaceae bacterium]|nr:BLUF domain-containing protein [Stellaceae bacterium]
LDRLIAESARGFYAEEEASRPEAVRPAIRQLVYISIAPRRYTDSEMTALLAQCRRSNAALGVTGVLLYKDGHFMQALEGPQDVVENLYARICRDPRHRDAIRMLDQTVDTRDFAEWSMGYRRLDRSDLPGDGFEDVLLKRGEPAEGESVSLHLLKRFAVNIGD